FFIFSFLPFHTSFPARRFLVTLVALFGVLHAHDRSLCRVHLLWRMNRRLGLPLVTLLHFHFLLLPQRGRISLFRLLVPLCLFFLQNLLSSPISSNR
ncbi:hypothetical protein PFISCL1PPCAC_16062, partial [Pristionchus fissidentatus]